MARKRAGEVALLATPRPVTPPPRRLTFFLEDWGNEVALMARDENGETWSVIILQNDGKFRRDWAISSDIGLDVDEKGRINEASSGY